MRCLRQTLLVAAVVAASATPVHADPIDDIVNNGPPVLIMGSITIEWETAAMGPQAFLGGSFATPAWSCTGATPGPLIVTCKPNVVADWKCIDVVYAATHSARGLVRGWLDCDASQGGVTAQTRVVSGTGSFATGFGVFGLDAGTVVCVADNGAGFAPTPGFVVECGG